MGYSSFGAGFSGSGALTSGYFSTGGLAGGGTGAGTGSDLGAAGAATTGATSAGIATTDEEKSLTI